MNPDEIQFTELPPTKGRGSSAPYDTIAAKLKERPGEWALVGAGVNVGIVKCYGRRGCEAVSRNSRTVNGRQVVDIYARWPEDGK